MRTSFAEVLSRESTRLAAVTDVETLKRWRRDLVRDVRTPESLYSKAVRQAGDAPGRADFLGQWRELIAQMVRQLLPFDASDGDPDVSSRGVIADVDAEKTAVVILSALLGGSILSRLTEDAQPLNSALDLALAPLIGERTSSLAGQDHIVQ